jgi:hypothetical protein
MLGRAASRAILAAAISVSVWSGVPPAALASAPDRGGPYLLTREGADFGTCGEEWARQTLHEEVDVSRNRDGTYRLTATVVHAQFVTVDGPSPGACDPRTGDGGAGFVVAGVTGSVTGRVIFAISGAFDPGGCARRACATYMEWFAATFGPGAQIVRIDGYSLEYEADAGQALVADAWRSASLDLGGDRGDIRSGP